MNRYAAAPYLLSVCTLLLSCAEFPTSFEEITDDKVRTIDFIYRNCADTALCEAAPGDSLELTAIFAGEKVRDITLTASFDVRTSLYGKTESFGASALDYSLVRSTTGSSAATDGDTFTIRFKVPDDLLATSTFLPERNWIAALPADLRPLIPESVTAMTRPEVAALLSRLSDLPAGSDSSVVDSMRLRVAELFPGGIETLLQFFSAQIEIRVLANNTCTTLSYATVRCHRLFRRLDSTVVCNRNPIVTRMGIYRVFRNNLTFFDPAIHAQPYEEMVLYDAAAGICKPGDTLAIRKNESYFLFVESDAPQPARGIGGAPISETHGCEWFFRQYAGTADTVDDDERMSVINGADGPIAALVAASAEAVTRCGIWVQVRDGATGPRLYPTGSTVFHTNLFFTYTSEYLNK